MEDFYYHYNTTFSFLDEYINEPLLLIKNKERQLHCLSNVCTHRGNILVEKHSDKITTLVDVMRAGMLKIKILLII